MARAVQKLPRVVGRRERGFTLIEMMVVVVIVGILAMLAVVGYRKLVQTAHVSEATNMVQSHPRCTRAVPLGDAAIRKCLAGNYFLLSKDGPQRTDHDRVG